MKAVLVLLVLSACGPAKKPLAPPEPSAHPVPVQLAWPDGGAPPGDALVGP